MNPNVVVLMPAFNVERFITAAVRSVIEQTYKEWELVIIVDPKSTDRTKNLAEDLAKKDGRIRVLIGPGGASANRNFGIRNSTAPLICFLDADDVWLKEKLERQLQFSTLENSRFVCTGYSVIDENGRDMNRYIHPPKKLFPYDLLRNNLIGCSTVMVSRDSLGSVWFKETPQEDLVFWLDLLKQNKDFYFASMAETLTKYRIVKSSRSGNKVKAAISRWKIIDSQRELPTIQKVEFFVNYAVSAIRRRI